MTRLFAYDPTTRAATETSDDDLEATFADRDDLELYELNGSTLATDLDAYRRATRDVKEGENVQDAIRAFAAELDADFEASQK